MFVQGHSERTFIGPTPATASPSKVRTARTNATGKTHSGANQIRSRSLANAPARPQPKGAAGAAIFSDRVWAEIARSLRFTRRELEIVRGVFDDRTEFAIAADLGISPHTVHTHLERLRHKLAVVDRAALILQVVQEFLRLTDAPGSGMPPVCGWRTAGLCQVCD